MKVAIASRIHPASLGGLAAYQRELASGLQNLSQCSGQFLSVQRLEADEDVLRWPAHTLLTQQRWQRQQRLVSRLASRRPLLSIADTVSCAMNAQGSWQAAVAGADVLHFVGTGWDIIGFPLLREARKAGLRFTVWPAVHPLSWGDDAFDVRLYRKADAVFCQSEHERAHLAARGVPESKLLRCGLPPMCRRNGDGAGLRTRLGIGKRPVVFFLGRRDAGKGYPALLDAWRLVARSKPDAVLLLAGPGPVDEARLAGLPQDSLRDLGCPDEADKANAYDACDIFCLPSAHESFGIVYVEAWSYGKPVICGSAPASRELVQNEVTGLWADQHPESLAAKLLHLLHDPEASQAMGHAGLLYQRTQFTTVNMIGSHIRAWRSPSSN